VHRMNKLIDGILEYSRVGRFREARQTLDLNLIVAEVLDSIAPPAHIRVQIASDFPTIIAEPTRIRQVFQNLLSNAVKHMDKPAGEIDIGWHDGGNTWQFHVRDSGPGIETRHFERIFQLFQTLAARDQVENTGVGLALVKKIIDLYHGRIWVESCVGSGTTFHFALPKALPPQTAQESVP
jgi:two-component system sensor kinase FixL